MEPGAISFETAFKRYTVEEAIKGYFKISDPVLKLALFRGIAAYAQDAAIEIAKKVTRHPGEHSKRAVQQARDFLQDPKSWKKDPLKPEPAPPPRSRRETHSVPLGDYYNYSKPRGLH